MQDNNMEMSTHAEFDFFFFQFNKRNVRRKWQKHLNELKAI